MYTSQGLYISIHIIVKGVISCCELLSIGNSNTDPVMVITAELLGFKQIIFAEDKGLPLKSTAWKVDLSGSIP